MTIPTSSFQLIFYLALLVPGVVFAAARVQLRGPRAADRSVAARILEAIVASAIFDSIYAAILASEVARALRDIRGYIAENLVSTVSIFLIGGVLIPYLVAWAIYGKVPFLAVISTIWTQKLRPRLTASQEASDTPTAWDYGNKAVVEGWVRVRLAPGVWVGGVFDERARFSTYPETRDLFIAEQWSIDEDGAFISPVVGSQGMWLAVRDDYVVEWLLEQEDSFDVEQQNESKQRDWPVRRAHTVAARLRRRKGRSAA